MRNVRALLAISAVSLMAVGCLKEQKPAAPPPQVPVAQPPVAELPPPEQTAPPAEQQPPTAPPAETGMAQPGQEQPQAQAPITQSTHDLVLDALLCGLPPGPMGMSMGGGPSPSGAGPQPGATDQESMPGQPSPEQQGAATAEARCGSLAPNVSASDFRQLDETAVRAVRDQIERRASEERLDDTMRMHLLALYDRGIAAEREALAGEKIGDQYAVAGAQRTAGQRPRTQVTGREGRAMGAGLRQQQAVPQADLAALSSHDRLRDLLQFARTSDAGALGSEAEGLAWVLGADRFVQVEVLPPRLKPFAAEPLFDALLGVPTPPQAQGLDVTKMTPAIWSQYLETAARTVGMGAPPGPTGAVDHDPYDASFAKRAPKQSAQHGRGVHRRGQGAIGGGQGQAAQPGAARPVRRGPAGQAARDQQNMREILTAVSQRMEALSRRMPASDLRIALDNYATELQSSQIGVGGGPHPGMMRPHHGGGGGTMGPGMQPPGGTMGPGTMQPSPSPMQPQGPQQQPGGSGYPSGAQPGTPSPLAPPAGNPKQR